MAGKAIYAALQAVQRDLKAPKDKNGGKYQYRSAEDILENVKPLLHDNGLILLLDDEILTDNVGSYIKATATLIDTATGDSLQTHATAREDVGTKLMSPGQATGACSSYARKYALCGLFAIDDSKDIDSLEYQNARKNAQNRPQQAGKPHPLHLLNQEIKRLNLTSNEVAAIAEIKFGKKSTREMTTDEIQKLADNLEAWAINGE